MCIYICICLYYVSVYTSIYVTRIAQYILLSHVIDVNVSHNDPVMSHMRLGHTTCECVMSHMHNFWDTYYGVMSQMSMRHVINVDASPHNDPVMSHM